MICNIHTELRSDARQKLLLSYTMVENGKKHRQNSHLIIHCPTSEGVSERANGRASGPVLQSVFLTVFDRSVIQDPLPLRLHRPDHLTLSICFRASTRESMSEEKELIFTTTSPSCKLPSIAARLWEKNMEESIWIRSHRQQSPWPRYNFKT